MANIDWIRLTDMVILATVVFLILYNIAAGLGGGCHATISARMQYHGYRFPIVVGVVVGVVCHWWWPVFGGSGTP